MPYKDGSKKLSWYERNAETIRERQRAYRERMKSDPEWMERRREGKRRAKTPESQRRDRLSRKYGLSTADYNRLWDEQGGVCAICKRPETRRDSTGRPQQLSVDHDHVTGAVRGLLCGKCNMGLGGFQDNIDWLFAGIEYLKAAS